MTTLRKKDWLQKCKKYLVCFTFLLPLNFVAAQEKINSSFGDGLQFVAADSSFSINLGFRFQTLYHGQLNLDNDQWNDRFLIRRSRLKFDGFAYHPSLTYKLELGLSARDISGGNNPENGNVARIIYDAVIMWQFSKSWTLWFGQAKLPGNRERVISSQKLQFVDRSILNSGFNLDRDAGLQLWHKSKLGSSGVLKQGLSISMGEGRDVVAQNAGGYDYTLRVDYLPFGEFKSKGDYFGSDLKKEEVPKLSIGVTYDLNNNAVKQMGQLGSYVRDSDGNQMYTDLSTFFVDAMFKYQGFSFMGEYADKESSQNVMAALDDGSTIKFFTGRALNLQVGQMIKKNEVAIRYSFTEPDDPIFSGLRRETQFTLGFSRYMSDHNLKIQTDVSYAERYQRSDALIYRLQLEVSL